MTKMKHVLTSAAKTTLLVSFLGLRLFLGTREPEFHDGVSDAVAAPSPPLPLRRKKTAMCMIVTDEEAYLDEFVDYHRALGFDAFFVYDNTAGFEMRQWGALKGAHVRVTHFPGPARQMAAYAACGAAVAATGDFEWAAFLDADEFLVLKRHADVADLLAAHCPRGGLGVNWFVFGANGWNVRAPEPVTRRFLYRDAGVNPHVKTLVRVDDMAEFRRTDPHNFVVLKDRMVLRDSNGKDIEGPFNERGPADVVVLHHYHRKSHKEYFWKRRRGRSDLDPADPAIELLIHSANRSLSEGLAGDHLPMDDSISKDPNQVFDDSAWRFLKNHVPGYALYDDIALRPAADASASAFLSTSD